MNTDFLIEENDIELAQNICKLIANDEVRNRAVADSLASKIAERFFDKDKLDVDIKSGLHNIGHVLEDIDIADIYINNSYIDVRLYFDDAELSVPKAHFDMGLLPVAYMFIKVTPDLSGATVTGFIQPENIDTKNSKEGFIAVDGTQLVSFYDIETLLVTKEDTYAVSENDIFAYLENNLKDKNDFYKALIASRDGRLRLARAEKAQYAFNFISINDDNSVAANNTDELLTTTDDLFSDDLTVDNLEAGDLEIEGLAPDDLVTEGADDLIDLEGDNTSLDLDASDDSMLLEEAEPETLDSSLDLIEEIEPTQTDGLGIPEEMEQSPAEDLTLADDIELENAFGDNLEEKVPEQVANEVSDNEISDLTLELDEDNENKETNSSFEFSTTTSPSLNSISDDIEDLFNEEQANFAETLSQSAEDTNNVDDLLSILPDENEDKEKEVVTPNNKVETSIPENLDNSDNAQEQNEDNHEQIEALFNPEGSEETEEDDISNFQYEKPKPKSSMKFLTVVALLVVIGAVGYLGFNHFANQNNQEEETNNLVADSVQTQAPALQEDAMPVESVESVAPKLDDNEGTAETIPAIEQNLDASILVSNLKVDWEVPAGYASNTSARRYLVKLGKVIQLNLKTELLLLNKPPITNKIAVEIRYNNGEKKFEAVGITVSSGEKSVDDLIMQTVNKALAMKLSVNSDSFNNLQGNPVLIIHL